MNSPSKNAIVTIITPSFFRYAAALLASLKTHAIDEFDFFCFLASNDDVNNYLEIEDLSGAHFLKPCNVSNDYSKEIYNKYFDNNLDKYRWSMKPVVINYLIKELNYNKVIYMDSDLYFYHYYDFIFKDLNHHRVLLSPHWRCSFTPEKDVFNFSHNFMHGIYNGGFIAVNDSATEIMSYWANLCLFACEQNLALGLHDDQKYLDIFQSVFKGVEAISHKGCNVSNWNQVECKRVLQSNDDVLIDGKFPVVFVHFTDGTIIDIAIGKDELLMPHLRKYNDHLLRIGHSFDLVKIAKQKHQAILEKFMEGNKKSNKFTTWFNKYHKIKNILFDNE